MRKSPNFSVNWLSIAAQGDLEPYKSLTIPTAYFLFENWSQHSPHCLAFEARVGGELVGLILAKISEEWQTVKLLSFKVEISKRRQGIGQSLFGFCQAYVIEKKLKGMSFEYDEKLPDAAALEKIVARHGWLPPRLYGLRCYFDCPAFHPKWFDKLTVAPRNIEIFPWGELTEKEREVIKHGENQGHFLPPLSPFNDEKNIEPINSLGLRYKGQIKGWCITERSASDTIRYQALYIDRDLHLTGLSIWLLAQSIRLQQASPIPFSLFEIHSEYIDPSWKHFIKKRLIPYAQRVERLKFACRIFSAGT